MQAESSEQLWAIECIDLKKTYPGKPPVEAVRGIDLHVEAGTCYGVLGPNGAGKTTTMEIIEGLHPATSGSVSVLGKQWGRDAQQIREKIGVSLQETVLSDRLTVYETLELFRSFYRRGISPTDAMSRVSLEEKAKSWVKNLSGGQKQRLAVATALVGDPQLIFLDEPTTGLDPSSRRQLWDIIESFRDNGKTTLLTTHYMEEAEKLCDRVAIFDQGKVIAEGTPSELIRSLGAEHVIEFSVDRTDGAFDEQTIRRLPMVDQLDRIDQRFHMTVEQPHIVLPQLIETLANWQINLSGLTTRHASLEDVFIHLTGRDLNQESTQEPIQ